SMRFIRNAAGAAPRSFAARARGFVLPARVASLAASTAWVIRGCVRPDWPKRMGALSSTISPAKHIVQRLAGSLKRSGSLEVAICLVVAGALYRQSPRKIFTKGREYVLGSPASQGKIAAGPDRPVQASARRAAPAGLPLRPGGTTIAILRIMASTSLLSSFERVAEYFLICARNRISSSESSPSTLRVSRS